MNKPLNHPPLQAKLVRDFITLSKYYIHIYKGLEGVSASLFEC